MGRRLKPGTKRASALASGKRSPLELAEQLRARCRELERGLSPERVGHRAAEALAKGGPSWDAPTAALIECMEDEDIREPLSEVVAEVIEGAVGEQLRGESERQAIQHSAARARLRRSGLGRVDREQSLEEALGLGAARSG